tara:strand:+ start:1524 stop:1946 length:423 start_codon:yes stop_codon:yes gene_type:complete
MTQLNNTQGNVQMPLIASNYSDEQGLEIYARFMRHLRCVPVSRIDIKVLSAIQFTADMVDSSDAHVSKTLVDMGLRAPRAAFPADFLKYADRALMRRPHDIGGPNAALNALKAYWDRMGEDKFACIKEAEYIVLDAEAVV